MKIFNWVHRKFHHKGGFGQNIKKAAELVTVTHETETQELLEHVSIDGILTIGTFGFGQLKQKNECWVLEKEESHEEEENEVEIVKEMNECDDEEVSPLLFNSFRGTGFDVKNCVDQINELGFEFNIDLEGNNKLGNEKKERITLADLLMADSDNYDVNTKKRDGGEVQQGFNYKKPDYVHAKKKGLSLSKKLIHSVGEDTRPIKKLNQLMRRMMKRKIHPDIEEKFQKGDDDQIKPAIRGLIADEYGSNELVSLLQTNDSIGRRQ